MPETRQVHYGQPLLLGQPEATAEHPRQEVLLSCEPPSREGGIGAAYQLLGRFVGFGHAALDRKSWNTIFMLVPAGEKQMGDVVDVNLGLRIVPLAPFSYLHGDRIAMMKVLNVSSPRFFCWPSVFFPFFFVNTERLSCESKQHLNAMLLTEVPG